MYNFWEKVKVQELLNFLYLLVRCVCVYSIIVLVLLLPILITTDWKKFVHVMVCFMLWSAAHNVPVCVSVCGN